MTVRLAENIAGLLVVLLVAIATMLVIGPPDPAAALAFLGAASGGVATLGDAAAFSGLLCWALVAALLCATAIQAARDRRRTSVVRHPSRALACALIATGLLVTALLHQDARDTLCCREQRSQVQEVVRLAG